MASDQPLLDMLPLLEGQDINQVPVVAGDRLLGMITRDHQWSDDSGKELGCT
ncbi:MAG: hypothetical protein KF722_10870 [Nitrospira sp.]|nr:hypothetical protein [Nitrospira sp.]